MDGVSNLTLTDPRRRCDPGKGDSAPSGVGRNGSIPTPPARGRRKVVAICGPVGWVERQRNPSSSGARDTEARHGGRRIESIAPASPFPNPTHRASIEPPRASHGNPGHLEPEGK